MMGDGEEIMNDKQLSYLIYESAMSMLERTIHRLFVLCLVMIILLVGSNGAWLWYESQFENVSIEQEVDTGEGDAYVAGGNIYGPGETDNQE